MSLATESMLVSMQINSWAAYKRDDDASKVVTQNAGAEGDAARVNKFIVPREALRPIQASIAALRAHLYESTLPWKDNGERLLPRKMYERFIIKHEELVKGFNAEVAGFLNIVYPSVIARADFRMGKLFDITDYPSVDELRGRFRVRLDFDAVTDASDFRVAMNQDQISRIKSGMESAVAERLAKAMSDVWSRLQDTLGHYANKMNSDEKFKASTVINLRQLVEIIPAMNILNDPNLDQIRQEIQDQIAMYEPDELRKDPIVRSNAGREASRILEDMKAFMTGMASYQEAAE